MNYRVGNIVFFVTSSREVRPAKIIGIKNELITIRFYDTGGGIRVRKSRLFPNEAAAKKYLKDKYDFGVHPYKDDLY